VVKGPREDCMSQLSAFLSSVLEPGSVSFRFMLRHFRAFRALVLRPSPRFKCLSLHASTLVSKMIMLYARSSKSGWRLHSTKACRLITACFAGTGRCARDYIRIAP
jgi:hypothetical protein